MPASPAVAPDPLGMEAVHPSWAAALEPVRPRLAEISAALSGENAAGHTWLPAPEHVLRAFHRPLAEVRVLLVGQDPYPTPGHAVGLAFSVAPRTPLPRSLANVLRELQDDVGVRLPDGDLSGWADQGVLLLNRVLTVRAGEPASHQSLGWQEVTECAVRAVVARGGPLVAVLWGRHAQSLQPLLADVPTITSAHPSPLSASRGFFGSRPFSQVDAHLRARGADAIRWDAPPEQRFPAPERHPRQQRPSGGADEG